MNLGKRAVNAIFNGKLMHISRFSVVGVLNTLVDFIIFTIFKGLIGTNYIFSQVIGYSCGITNSFIFNRKWTFKDRNSNKKIYSEIVEFTAVNMISLLITLFTMKFTVGNLKMNVYVSKILVTVLAQITNFSGYKMLVFKK